MQVLFGFQVKNYRESKKTKRHRTVTVYFLVWEWSWTSLKAPAQQDLLG